MRLSDARLRRRQIKLVYPNHRSPSLAHRRRYPARSLEPIVSGPQQDNNHSSSSARGSRCHSCPGPSRQADHPVGKFAISKSDGSFWIMQPRHTIRPSFESLVVPQRNCHMPSSESCVTRTTGSEPSKTCAVVRAAVFTGSKKDHSSEEKSCVCADMSANDEVERRGVVPASNEGT